MASESTQHRLSRVRPPRVQITYDVEIGGAIEKRELPFVVGVVADLSGQPEAPLPRIADRRFVEIDRDNFDQIMQAAQPRAAVQVNNEIAGDGSKLNIELKFSSFDDFDPVNIVKQVKSLERLYSARQRLRDLLGKLDGNDDLDRLLQEVVGNTDGLNEIRTRTPAIAAPEGVPSKERSGDDAPSAPPDGSPS